MLVLHRINKQYIKRKKEKGRKEGKESPFSASSQDGREDKMSMTDRCGYGYRSGYR